VGQQGDRIGANIRLLGSSLKTTEVAKKVFNFLFHGISYACILTKNGWGYSQIHLVTLSSSFQECCLLVTLWGQVHCCCCSTIESICQRPPPKKKGGTDL
jgi:hypothetical protein